MNSNFTLDNIYLDGHHLQDVKQVQEHVNTLDKQWSTARSNVQATITFTNGTQLTFFVVAKEIIDDSLYLYGILPEIMPDMFKSTRLEDWQIQYLESTGHPNIDRFKFKRNDAIFKTEIANMFMLGFERGRKWR